PGASVKALLDPAAERRFERMAMCLPTYPERAENVAPGAKAPAVSNPRRGPFWAPIATAKRIARADAIRAIDLYCRRRNARAPCWIAVAISRIRSDPVSRRRMSRPNRPADPRPARPALGMLLLRSPCALPSDSVARPRSQPPPRIRF